MNIRVISAAQLSPDHVAAWSRLQRADAALANPFFRPEFTQTVAAVRDDVEVVIWEQAGEPVGFLPFERSSGRVGRPVGSHINEFQGAIARADVSWSPREVVRAAGLRAWRFDHLVANQAAFGPFQYVVADSPYLDLSNGFEHYRKSGTKSTSNRIADAQRQERKAARDMGEVRIEVNPVDGQPLAHMLEWKTDQCRRTQSLCNCGVDWVVDLFKRLLDHSTPDFSGMLICLYFGNRPAAIRFALRSGNVLHGIVSAYDRDLSKYSPGSILIVRTAQEASSLGITRIDLGKGSEVHKNWYASGHEQVTEGVVHSRPLHAPLYRGWFRAKDRLRSTRLRGPVRRVRRWMFSTRLWLGYAE